MEKSTRALEKLLGFAGLCQAMNPKDVDKFAYICKTLEQLGSPLALSVLYSVTGELLEHS